MTHVDRVAEGDLSFRDLARRLGVRDLVYHLSSRPADEMTIILKGDFFIVYFHSGLHVHATDAVEQEDAQTEITLAPSFTVSVLLEGTVTAAFDDKRFDLSAGGGAAGKVWSLARPTRLSRWTRRGQRVRKVNISATPAWFGLLDNGESGSGLERPAFLHSHLATLDWRPGETAIRLAHEILAARQTAGMMGRLSLEMNAIGILKEAFAACSALLDGEGPAAQPGQARLSKRNRERAEAVCRYIDRGDPAMPTLTDIAVATGMSISTLKRVFKAAYGISVIDFLRSRRLEIARHLMTADGLSIQQAAHAAGYSSAANFATAFKRAFGYSPSQR